MQGSVCKIFALVCGNVCVCTVAVSPSSRARECQRLTVTKRFYNIAPVFVGATGVSCSFFILLIIAKMLVLSPKARETEVYLKYKKSGS